MCRLRLGPDFRRRADLASSGHERTSHLAHDLYLSVQGRHQLVHEKVFGWRGPPRLVDLSKRLTDSLTIRETRERFAQILKAYLEAGNVVRHVYPPVLLFLPTASNERDVADPLLQSYVRTAPARCDLRHDRRDALPPLCVDS